MKRTIQYLATLAMAACVLTACEKDDTDFSKYTNGSSSSTDSGSEDSNISTIYIAYSGNIIFFSLISNTLQIII